MKIDMRDIGMGTARLTMEDADDLWVLYTVLEPDDVIKMRSLRKVKVGSSERAQQVVKKPMTLALKVEKITFDGAGPAVRTLGIVLEGPDDVPKGGHHSFNISVGDTPKITKEWKQYQLKKIKEAAQTAPPKIVLVLCDREKAIIARMERTGYRVLTKLDMQVAKKHDKAEKGADFIFSDIIKSIEELAPDAQAIVVGSPSFWHPRLSTAFAEVKIPHHLATVAHVSEQGFDELLKRPETQAVLAEQRAMKEVHLVEKLLGAISRDDPHTYGLDDSAAAADAGAVEELLISENLIMKRRDEGTFAALERVMRVVEQSRGHVHLISGNHDAGKKLDGLGGIAAILRYAVNL